METIENKELFPNKKIARLVIPLLIEQLLNVFVGMVDVLMVTKAGESALSGVSLVDSVNNLIIQVLFAMTAAGTVIAARFKGAKNESGQGRTIAQLILITVAATSMVTTIILIGRDSILNMLFGGVEADVMASARIYMFITCLSFPFLALYQSGTAAFRAMSNTKVPMIVSLIMNIENIIGNAILLFIFNMGAAGVAIATTLSRATAAIIIIKLYQNKNNKARLKKEYFSFDKNIVKDMLSIGIPNSIETSIFQLGKVLLQSLVSTFDTHSIAGFAVASNLVSYLYLPGSAMGAAMMTVVGQCYGAGQPTEAKRYSVKLIKLNYMILMVVAPLLIIFRYDLCSLYDLSSEAKDIAAYLVMIHSIAMILWPMGFLTPYYFRSVGKAKFTMVCSILVMWIFRIGFAYIYVKVLHMDVSGIWFAMFTDWVVRVSIYAPAFIKHNGKNTQTSSI